MCLEWILGDKVLLEQNLNFRSVFFSLSRELLMPSLSPFQCRKHKDLYLWMAKCPNAPSVKFLVNPGNFPSQLVTFGICDLN